MKKVLFILLIQVLIYGCIDKKEQDLINYKVSPVVINEEPMLSVNLKIKPKKEESQTTLLFLNDSWGEKNLHNVIEELNVLDERYNVELKKDSGWVVISHPKNTDFIELTYIIKQDFEEEITSNRMYRPVIQETYFHIFSHNFFMLPLDYLRTGDQKFDVSISWLDFPDSFNIVNTFGKHQTEQLIRNTSEKEFMESVFLGGDYRSYTIPIKNNEVVFSIRDQWEVLQDSILINILSKTIQAQRDFWNDHSQPYFSVNLTPTTEKQGSSFQGTGLTNSFNCSASNNNNLQLDGLIYLFNHELQHNWIGHIIENSNEEQQYWFSEGFTDYYTYKNIANYKLNDLDEDYFINELNGIIKALYTSSVKEAPNSEINYENFWSSREYEKLPYRRGALFAFYLDHKIRKDSKGKFSLDDLMLAIKEDALKGQKIEHSYFLKKANTFLDHDISGFFKKHIEDGKLIELEKIFNEFGFEYSVGAFVFDQGYEMDQSTNTVLFIDETSNAFKAGLRKGDKLNGWSIYYGQPDIQAELIINKDEKENKISFYPSKKIDLPQLLNTETNRLKLKL